MKLSISVAPLFIAVQSRRKSIFLNSEVFSHISDFSHFGQRCKCFVHCTGYRSRHIEEYGSFMEFTGQMDKLNDTLTEVQNNATDLQTAVTNLTMQLENLTECITWVISNCSDPNCTMMIDRVNSTSVDVSYTNIESGYIDITKILNKAIQCNLSGALESGYSNFKLIITEVDESVSDEIEVARDASFEVAVSIREELDRVEEDVTGVDFAGISADLRVVSEDDMELPAYIIFWSLVSIASVLALIVLLTYVGLLFSCCPRAKKESDYCCTKKVGATFLLAAVGFIFIFYWIMLLVLVYMFLAGGLTQTEVCRHLVALDESPISDIINDLANASFYKDTGFSINITQIYTNCKENKAFYIALDVKNTFGFDLDALLDTTEIENQINVINNINITIDSIEILSRKTLKLLNILGVAVSNAANDTVSFLAELEREVTTEDLMKLAQDLRELADHPDVTGLNNLANELESLYNNTVTAIDSQRKATYSQLADAHELLKINITEIAKGLEEGQNITNSEGESIIEDVIKCAATTANDSIDLAVETIDNNVRNEIGKCEPVYNAVATIADSACVELLYALNGYWFALGWSIFFLLISVTLSLRLSSLYREKMVYDEVLHEERRDGRALRHQGQKNTGSTVLIVRANSYEMMPVNNPAYTLDDQYHNRIPRPHLKQGIAANPREMAHL